METSFYGKILQSPFIIGSGPLSYGAEGIIALHNAGAGAIVTKTIRNEKAHNPEPHIAAIGQKSMINAEKWSDYDGEQWIEREIPMAVKAGAAVIASIGHTADEVEKWLPLAEKAGAFMFELVSYEPSTMIPMVIAARKLTKLPFLVKISPNWSDAASAALQCLEEGADGITAMDSLGPVLSINIETGKPSVVGDNGMGWLTGSALKPLSLRYVAEVASKTDKPIVGLGGVMSADDAVEMVMAGASAVGICSYPMLQGIESINKLTDSFYARLKSLGYDSLESARGVALEHLFKTEDLSEKRLHIKETHCRMCMMCIKRCPYHALSDNDGELLVDTELCRRCALCVSSCNDKNLELVS
jgi:dihydroorotate dehydrogenase/ferredoxin-like protein FixX